MKSGRKPILYLLAAAMIFLHGCESLGPKLQDKRFVESQFNKVEAINNGEPAEQTLTPSEQQASDSKPQVYEGSGIYLNRDAVQPKPVERGEGSYTLNFNNVDLVEVIKVILGDALKYNYTISPQVSGQITLQTTRALSKEELLPTLQMLLKINKAVLIEDDSFYRVEPLEVALTGGSVPFAAHDVLATDSFQIQVVPLEYIGVADMTKILEPILSKKAILQSNAFRNLLFISGTPAELAEIRDLVALFDVDVMRGRSVGLYPLVHVAPKVLEKELQEIFNTDADQPLAGMLKMITVERMNALMVLTTQPSYLSRVEQWINRLDRPGPRGQSGDIHVYPVQNVSAVELANVLEQIYSGPGYRSTVGTQSTLAPGMEPVLIQSRSQSDSGELTPAAIPPLKRRSASNPKGLMSEAQGEIRIIPDEMNNALIILSSAQDFQSLKKVIDQMDVTPLQVLVDATIIEVSLTDELHYGLQWFFTNRSGRYSGSGSVGDSNFNAAGDGGFAYSLVNRADIVRAELNALAIDSRVNVLSAPSLMVLNNQEATIKVGDQVPIRTSESSNTNAGAGSSAIITSTIQMRDTGVTLTVKPRVNAGGLVVMDIEQNVDGVSRTESSEIDSPTIQQRQIKSSVAVQSGETIVLGGLITEQREQGKSGVPVLSRLPVMGGLFGKTDKVLDRTELVILLTPRVVRNHTDARQVTREFKNKLTDIYSDLNPEGQVPVEN